MPPVSQYGSDAPPTSISPERIEGEPRERPVLVHASKRRQSCRCEEVATH